MGGQPQRGDSSDRGLELVTRASETVFATT